MTIMINKRAAHRAEVRATVPVIGVFRDPDATCTLTNHLFTAVQRVTERAVKVEEPAPVDTEPGGFYCAPVQSLSVAKCQGRVVLTQWETNQWPAAAVTALNTARAVVTISPWCEHTLRASGVIVPLHHVELGVDPMVFKPAPEVYPQAFTFLTAGRNRGDRRKGFENVLAAFILAFPNDPRVLLRVKLGPGDPLPDFTSGRVQFIREHLPAERLAALYQTATCYVNGSYGEGWGWHMHEAMACGCPVISTHWGGPTAYLDRTTPNFYRVPHKLVRAHEHFGKGLWAQPDLPSMAEAMLTVVANARHFLCLGEAAAASVRHLTQARMLSQLTEIVKRYVKFSPLW